MQLLLLALVVLVLDLGEVCLVDIVVGLLEIVMVVAVLVVLAFCWRWWCFLACDGLVRGRRGDRAVYGETF